MSSQGSEGSQESTQDYVNDTVLYILSQDHNKYPIKRQDIVKYALKNNGKNFKHAMEEATNILKQVFGMNLIEVEHGSTKHHILVNGIKNPGGLMEFKWSNEEEAHQILLMIVLSFIFMTGGVAKEESVWTFLTKLGILWTNKPHELFGDVRKLLTQEFVRQLYIEYIRIPDTDPPKYDFRWGQRAEKEVSRRAILEFVSMIHGKSAINTWTPQYQEMLNAEEKDRETD